MINLFNKIIGRDKDSSLDNVKLDEKERIAKILSWVPEKTNEEIIPIILSLNVNNYSQEELKNRGDIKFNDLSEEEKELVDYYYYELQDVANDTEESRVVLN